MQTVSEAFVKASEKGQINPYVRVELFGNNLAFDKPIYASSQESGWNYTNANNAIIDTSEGWKTKNVGAEIPTEYEWIKIDLLWETGIDRMILYPIEVSGVVRAFPKRFRIQWSKDNVLWWTIKEVKDLNPISQAGETIDFDLRVARWWRIEVIGFRQDADGYYRAGLCEIQIMKQPVVIYDSQNKGNSHIISIGEVSWDLESWWEWKVGNIRLSIDNSQNQWEMTNPAGLFQGQRSLGAQIKIFAGYFLEDGTVEAVSVFTGYIKDPVRHSDGTGTLVCYDIWSKLDRVNIDGLKDPATSAWYANQRADFLAKKIFLMAGFTKNEIEIEECTTTIVTANFENMTAREGLTKISEMAGYDVGVSPAGKGFFRQRKSKSSMMDINTKHILECSDIGKGWEDVINCYTAKNSSGQTVTAKASGDRPNSFDRYGYIRKDIENKFISQLGSSEVVNILNSYLTKTQEAKIRFDAKIIYMPHLELGDVHTVTQREPFPYLLKAGRWDDNLTRWDMDWVWGIEEGYLINKLVCQVGSFSINLDDYTMRVRYIEQ